MKRQLLGTSGLVALAAVAGLATSPAHATAITGSTSVVSFNVQAFNSTGGPTDLFHAASLTLSTNFFGTGTGDFTLITSGTSIGNATFVPTNFSSLTLASADGTFSSANSVIVGGSTFSSLELSSGGGEGTSHEAITWYLVGNFTTAGTTGGLDNDTADLTLAFTETSNGTSINHNVPSSLGSFSVSATLGSPATAAPPPPPPTNVPEPASIALLGAGLFGLGAVRRRRS